MCKTIAIIGASGFTGGAIARHFVTQGWRVLGFGRRSTAIEGVEYHQWDITRPIKKPIRTPIDVVVHSAAKVDDFGAYEAFYKANVLGTQHVLEAFREAGQFIYISSASVYDPFAPNKENIREDFPYGTRYLNAYGETKMQAEVLILKNRHENSVILRPRAIYGVGDTTLLPRLVRARRGQFLFGIGDGENLISLTYIENLLHAIDCVVKKQFSQAVFNIADVETITMRELLTAFADHMGWRVQLIFIPIWVAWGIATFSETISRSLPAIGTPQLSRYSVHQLSSPYSLSIEKAKSLLGYAPMFQYRDGFAAIKSWLEQSKHVR